MLAFVEDHTKLFAFVAGERMVTTLSTTEKAEPLIKRVRPCMLL
jgi:hypothetical protein